MRCTVFFLILLAGTFRALASDIIDVRPLTDRILMIHFRDGYVAYHGRGDQRTDDRAYVEPLSIDIAGSTMHYILSSEDDIDYQAGVNPVDISRKSKGMAFTWLCEGWGAQGCINESPDHVREHWIYLFLPEPMENGARYTLNTTNLAKNGQNWVFTYNETESRSEAVHVNLVGYSTASAAKYGYVYHWMGDAGGLSLSDYSASQFRLIELHSRQTRYTGSLVFRKSSTNVETFQEEDTPRQNFLGAEVYECDFSDFNTPGIYILSVEGIGCSFPFRIGPDVYRDSFYHAIRGLYHNRSGIALEASHTGYPRPAPHNPLLTPGFENKLLYTSSRFIDWQNGNYSAEDTTQILQELKGPINTWGWYQDAGDWDGYFSHMTIPTLLMLTYEMVPDHFRDGELNLPESGNDLPDILDEASWLMRFFYRTRKALMENNYGTGGIGSRITGDHFGNAPEGRASYEDTDRRWIISGEDPHSTYKYAALAAHFAYILARHGFQDPENIPWSSEAAASFEWAENNTRVGDESLRPAMPHRLSDIRMYAAAALYRLTKKEEYREILIQDSQSITASSLLEGEQRWGAYVYALMEPDEITDTDHHQIIRAAVMHTADFMMLDYVDMRACRWGGNPYFPMLVGQATTPQVIEGMMGWAVSRTFDPVRADQYLANIHTTCDYFLGTNPLNMAWVTQLGERNPDRVLHLDSWYNGKPGMAPGIIPYGPWRHQDNGSQIGPWDLRWPYKTIFPENIHVWPGHERWFNNYTCPSNAEFTVHQNTVLSAVAYGFLCGKAGTGTRPNRKPVVTITDPVPGTNLSVRPLEIHVQVADPDGPETINRVAYYNNWHLIGQSYEPPFDFTWDNFSSGELKLVARVFDQEGAWGISDTVHMNASVILGTTDDQAENTMVRVYPNPANQKIWIQGLGTGRFTFRLWDLNGSIMLEERLNKGKSISESIQVMLPAGLPPGIYIYDINTLPIAPQKRRSGKIVLR